MGFNQQQFDLCFQCSYWDLNYNWQTNQDTKLHVFCLFCKENIFYVKISSLDKIGILSFSSESI